MHACAVKFQPAAVQEETAVRIEPDRAETDPLRDRVHRAQLLRVLPGNRQSACKLVETGVVDVPGVSVLHKECLRVASPDELWCRSGQSFDSRKNGCFRGGDFPAEGVTESMADDRFFRGAGNIFRGIGKYTGIGFGRAHSELCPEIIRREDDLRINGKNAVSRKASGFIALFTGWSGNGINTAVRKIHAVLCLQITIAVNAGARVPACVRRFVSAGYDKRVVPFSQIRRDLKGET